jgi:hypothetical protein
VGAALASHGRGHRFETCHAHHLARLASAYALSGSPDTSVPKGWEAVAVAQATGSRRITTELGQLGSRLTRWGSMPEVGQLLKELRAA